MGEGRLHAPGVAIAVDVLTRSIVLVFRGSLWPQDMVTDLDCEPQKCVLAGERGWAHSGMLTAARSAASRFVPIVAKLLTSEKYGDFRLIVTGHSLGAGVAALVTAIWIVSPSSPVQPWVPRISCIGFGMPAIASPNFRSIAMFEDRITAVVCGADVVPRFSLGSSLRLRNAVLRLWSEQTTAAAAAVR